MAGLEGPEPFASLEDPEAEEPKEKRKEPEKASAKQKAKAKPKKELKPKERKKEADTQEPEGKAREAEDKACDLATPRKDGGLFDDDDNVDLLQTLLQEGLCVTPQPSKNQVPHLTPEKVPAAEVSSEVAYKPGKFGDARKTFIKRKMGTDNVRYADAQSAWMLSSERAQYLASMSESELKRRRFA